MLDPTDLPIVICLNPNGGRPSVRVTRGVGEGEARIAGPLAALIGLVHGAFDGDALLIGPSFVIEEHDLNIVVDVIAQAMADVLD